jgi:hypothetical protein
MNVSQDNSNAGIDVAETQVSSQVYRFLLNARGGLQVLSVSVA